MRLLYKSRSKPSELIILEALQHRMQLSKADQQNLYNLTKGYEGELLFDSLLEKLECDNFLLNDLLLKTNNQTFQIDSLLITRDLIYVFEIKNFIGDFHYISDQILKKDNSEITNPLFQLFRTEALLRQLLQKLNFSTPIQSSVVFVNPEFVLYQAPSDKPFIFPNQLNRFIQKLNTNRAELLALHKRLAENFMSLHISENPYRHLPSYNYQQLRKGILCTACHSFSIEVNGRRCICTLCGNVEHIDSAIMRTINEYKLLFPNERITTNKIFDWCKIITSKKRIQRILKNNFKLVDVHRWVYYE